MITPTTGSAMVLHPSCHSAVESQCAASRGALPARPSSRVAEHASRARSCGPAARPCRTGAPCASGNRANRWCSRSSTLIAGAVARAEHVRHHHGRRGRVGGAERVVEHRAQVLLELRGAGALDRPVAGVVRAHRQLVDDAAARAAVSNSSTASSPTTPSSAAIRSASSCAWRARCRRQARRRGEHLDADAVGLHGLDHRPRGALPERRARDQRGQLAAHRHALLDHQRRAGVEQLGDQLGASGASSIHTPRPS